MKRIGKLTKTIDKQTYEVTTENKNITHIPRSRSETVNVLKAFVMNECGKCWQFENSKIATLKKTYLRELCEKLK